VCWPLYSSSYASGSATLSPSLSALLRLAAIASLVALPFALVAAIFGILRPLSSFPFSSSSLVSGRGSVWPSFGHSSNSRISGSELVTKEVNDIMGDF
jgi:hypothetical protein